MYVLAAFLYAFNATLGIPLWAYDDGSTLRLATPIASIAFVAVVRCSEPGSAVGMIQLANGLTLNVCPAAVELVCADGVGGLAAVAVTEAITAIPVRIGIAIMAERRLMGLRLMSVRTEPVVRAR